MKNDIIKKIKQDIREINVTSIPIKETEFIVKSRHPNKTFNIKEDIFNLNFFNINYGLINKVICTIPSIKPPQGQNHLFSL